MARFHFLFARRSVAVPTCRVAESRKFRAGEGSQIRNSGLLRQTRLAWV